MVMGCQLRVGGQPQRIVRCQVRVTASTYVAPGHVTFQVGVLDWYLTSRTSDRERARCKGVKGHSTSLVRVTLVLADMTSFMKFQLWPIIRAYRLVVAVVITSAAVVYAPPAAASETYGML